MDLDLWWPDRVCLELVDDKVQAGYREFAHDQHVCAAAWLEAWPDVLRLCDATGIRSIEVFDERFPMTQSLYTWSQDLEDVLWNAGLSDREMLRARIAVCAEPLRRFPAEDQLMTENRRRALAESYFELGETGKAEELFGSWLADDPRWGFGWIGWAGCYLPDAGRPKDSSRAEELLRRGYATARVRDRDAIADWLQMVCDDTGRQPEAEVFARRADKVGRQPARVSVPPRPELAEEDEETSANAPGRPAQAVKVGRNAPCPCGSGKDYKKCCASPNAGDRAADA